MPFEHSIDSRTAEIPLARTPVDTRARPRVFSPTLRSSNCHRESFYICTHAGLFRQHLNSSVVACERTRRDHLCADPRMPFHPGEEKRGRQWVHSSARHLFWYLPRRRSCLECVPRLLAGYRRVESTRYAAAAEPAEDETFHPLCGHWISFTRRFSRGCTLCRNHEVDLQRTEVETLGSCRKRRRTHHLSLAGSAFTSDWTYNTMLRLLYRDASFALSFLREVAAPARMVLTTPR